MSIAPSPSRARPAETAEPLPPLVEGQRLDQPTFHERYQAMPPHVRAELIDGVVSMPSPLGLGHSDPSIRLITWLDRYAEFTPGTHVLNSATVILGGRSEVQPDAALRVLPECGGRSRDEKGYVGGGPELVVEVSRSSRYVDLGPKFNEYERACVLEYLVRSVEPDEVLWFAQQEGRLVRVSADDDGLYRSRSFPGLWLDPAALLANDRAGVRAALDRGVASPEHAEFVARLAAAKGEKEART